MKELKRVVVKMKNFSNKEVVGGNFGQREIMQNDEIFAIIETKWDAKKKEGKVFFNLMRKKEKEVKIGGEIKRMQRLN